MTVSAVKAGPGISDNYKSTVSQRNSCLILLIFAGGFAAAVIPISCINPFNTIHRIVKAPIMEEIRAQE